jgi:hypothetical protein
MRAQATVYKNAGSTVETYTFKLTSKESKQIVERIKPSDGTNGIGELGPDPWDFLSCSEHVCEALQGIGPFKNLGINWFPGNLADELKQLSKENLPILNPFLTPTLGPFPF